MIDGTIPPDELQQKLSQLSPERRALVERMLRARTNGATAEVAAPAKDAGIPRRTDSSRAPLSAIQRFLWLLTQATPGLYAYNAPRAYRLRGELDVYALQTALNGLVARHEVFRTRFVPEGDDAIQVIDAPRVVPL